MNANNFLSPRLMVGAAIVGLVGAAGVFLYEQMYAEKKRAMLVSEVARLDKQVSSMRVELEALRELQKEAQLRRLEHKNRVRQRRPRVKRDAAATPSGDTVDHSCASDSEYYTDYQSVAGTDGDMDSEEFYDVHTDDDDDTLRETRNGRVSPAPSLDDDLSDKADKPESPPLNSTSK